MSEDLLTTIKVTVDASGVASGVEGAKRSLSQLGKDVKKISEDASASVKSMLDFNGPLQPGIERVSMQVSKEVGKATTSVIKDIAKLDTEIQKYGTAAFTGFSNIGKSAEQAYVAMAGKDISETHINAYIAKLREAQGVQKFIDQEAAKSAATQSGLIQKAIADQSAIASANSARSAATIANSKDELAAIKSVQDAALNLKYSGSGKSSAFYDEKFSGVRSPDMSAALSAYKAQEAAIASTTKSLKEAADIEAGIMARSVAENTHFADLKRQHATYNKTLSEQAVAATKVEQQALQAFRTEIQNAELNLVHFGRAKTAAFLQDKGARLGFDPALVQAELTNLSKIEAANKAAFTAANPHIDQLKKNAEAAGTSVKGLSVSMRNVPAQFTDIIVSLQGGQAPLTVLLQQGGQLKDMFGGVGNASRALGGYIMGLINPYTLAAAAVATLGIAYFKGAAEGEAYNKALILTGNSAGTTAGQLANMAQSVAKTTGGTIGSAAEALAQIAGAGTIARAQFDKVAATAIGMEKVTGVAMSETIKQFAALGKDPVTESAKLNLTTNYLTQSVYAQIVALDEQGRKSEAAALAQSAYADAMKSRIPTLSENLGIVEKAWNAVWGASKRAWDGMLNVGREDSLVTKMATDSANVARIQAQILGVSAFATTGGGAATGGASASRKAALEAELISAQEVLRNSQEMVRMEKRGAEAAGERARIQADGISATDAITKANERASSEVEKMNKALRDYRKGISDIRTANPESSLLDPAKIAATEASIRNSFAKKGGSKIKEGDEFASERAAAQEWERFYLAVTKDALDAEIAVLGLSKAQKDLIDYTRSTGYSGVSTESKLIVINKLNEAIALEQAAKAQKEATKQAEEASKIYAGDLAKISEKILKLNEENAAIQAQTEGMLNHSIVVTSATTLADLEAAANYGAAISTVERARASAIARSATAEEVAGMQEAIDHLTRLKKAAAGAAAAGAGKDMSKAGQDQAKRLGLDVPSDPFKDWGKTLKDTFGTAAEGLNQVLAGMSALSASDANYLKEIELINAAKAAGAAPNATAEQQKTAAVAARSEQALIKQTKAAQLDSYAAMAVASKTYFAKHTAAYQVLDGIEQAAHLMQMANLAEKLFTSLFGTATAGTAETAQTAFMLTEHAAAGVVDVGLTAGTEAAKNGLKAPGVIMSFMSWLGPWGMAAAGIAIAAVLGKSSGGSASVSTDAFSAQAANTGTGTVFGDSSAQSKSIENSLSALEGMAKPELAFISKMVTLLQGIKDGLQGTTNAILNSGIDLSGADFTGSSSSSGGGIMGALFGSSSSSTSLTDLGLKFAKQSIEQSIQSISLEKYQTTRTDRSSSGFLGFGSSSSTSYATQSDQIGDNGKLAASLSNIVSKASTLITEAATKLGATPAQLKAMGEVDNGLGKISLKGLKSEEVTALLGSVFSAMTDTMAMTVMPELVEFNKTGTGYSETLIKISAATETAGQIIDKLGLKEVKLADLRNKLAADTSAELVRQSIMDAETASVTLSGIGEIIKTLTGSDAELGALYTSLTDARTALVTLGFSADIVGTQLLKGAGGMDALTQGLADYAEGFLSAGEQLALKQAAMDDKFKLIGLTTPATAAGFVALVDGLKAGGAASAEQLGKVIVLSAGMKDLTDAMGEAATEAATKLMTAFTGTGKLVPAMKSATLKAGDLAGATLAMSGEMSYINSIMGDATSTVIGFSNGTYVLSNKLSDSQASASLLTDQIALLKDSADKARIDFIGLDEALKNVDTAAFMSSITQVFENLATRIQGVIGDISTERMATASAAIGIINPQEKTAGMIKSEIAAINTAGVSVSGVTAANSAWMAANNRAATQSAALDRAQAQSNSVLAQAKNAAATLQSAKDGVATAVTVMNAATIAKGVAASNQSSAQSTRNNTSAGWRVGYSFGRSYWQDNTGAVNTAQANLVAAQSAYATSIRVAESATSSYSASVARYNALVNIDPSIARNLQAQAQEALNVAQAANTSALAGQASAQAAAKAAVVAFSSATQAFILDAAKSVTKLAKLREETVKYYDAQSKLSDLMTKSAADIRGTITAYRFSQKTDEQKYQDLNAQFGSAYTMSKVTTGESLAGYGDKINALINPMVDILKATGRDGLINSYLAQAEDVAKSVDAGVLSLGDYQQESLDMLASIDSALYALDISSQTAEKMISAAVKAGADQTSQGLRSVIAALTGQSIPAFATGGDHLGGLRLVGENGPELEATGPSRIFTAAQTKGMLSGGGGGSENSEMVAELRALRAEVANLRIEARATAVNTGKVAKTLDRVTPDGNSLQMVVAA